MSGQGFVDDLRFFEVQGGKLAVWFQLPIKKVPSGVGK